MNLRASRAQDRRGCFSVNWRLGGNRTMRPLAAAGPIDMRLSKVQSVDQRMRLGMRCRLSPTADVPSHTSGAAMCPQADSCTSAMPIRSPRRQTQAARAAFRNYPTGSASRSRMQELIWSRSDLVMQNMAKCAHRLSTTRNLLFGISFCSASQSAGGKNMSHENGTT